MSRRPQAGRILSSKSSIVASSDEPTAARTDARRLKQRILDALAHALRVGARSGTVGALVGVVISIGEQIATQVSTQAHDGPHVLDRLLGALMSAAFFCAAAFGGGFWGAVVARALARRAHSRLQAALAAVAVTLIVLFHAIALGCKLMLGSALTMTGLKFFKNSARHMMAAFATQYVKYFIAIGVVSVLLGVLVAFAMRAATRQLSVRRAEVAVASLLAALALVSTKAPLPSAFARGVSQTNPEIALIASVHGPRGRGPWQLGGAAAQQLVESASASPKITTTEDWARVARETGDRPNFVLITLESVGANHVGFLGYDRGATPNLDRIASESLVFARAYATATHSNYSQMAILSSLFPRRGTGLDMYERLDYPRVLLHDFASVLGYASATQSSQDETWQGMLRFQTTGTPVHYRHALDYQGDHLDLVTEGIVPDETTAQDAIKWIDSLEPNKPFSLYVNFQSTHFPYPIPPSALHPFGPGEPEGTFNYVRWDREELPVILDRYDNALYYVDTAVGYIFDALEDRGLLENTVFVVTSDHGEFFFEHDIVTHGRTLYEEESRVPFIVRYPRVLDPAVVTEAVSNLDVLPTMLDLAGLPPHPAHQGESDVHLRDPNEKRKTGVFMNIQGWKLYDGLVCMPYKLIFDPDTQATILYDLVADPHEMKDVSGEHPAITLALSQTLHAQLDAQERYHADDAEGRSLRADRFAPRLLACPDLPAQ
ncbi:MAG: sulfatase [Polyangiaceae bacterium]